MYLHYFSMYFCLLLILSFGTGSDFFQFELNKIPSEKFHDILETNFSDRSSYDLKGKHFGFDFNHSL